MSILLNYNHASCFYDNQRAAVGSDVIAAMIQLKTGKHLKDLHVLDAGCGTGSYAKALMDIGVGYMTLLDASAGMLERAKAKLSNYLEQGRIKEVIECKLPDIPIPDDSVDAVLFTTVLNHLDRANSDFPNCIKTLKESCRVLKPEGMIVVTSILPEIFADAIWLTQINKKLTQRYIEEGVPSLYQHYQIFDAASVTCIQKMNILGSDMFKYYHNTDEPLEESLSRNFNEYWSFAKQDERAEIMRRIRNLKENGELETWIKTHDHTNTTGPLTVMICQPIV